MSGAATGAPRCARRIIELFVPYARQQSACLLCMIAACVFGLVPPIMTARIIDSAIPHGDMRELLLDVGGMFGATVLAALATIGYGYLSSLVGEAIVRDLRTKVASHLHRLPVSFFVDTTAGDVLNRVGNDIENVNDVVSSTLTTVVTNAVGVICTLVVMTALDWRLTLLTIPVVVVMVLPVRTVGRTFHGIRRRAREARDRLESVLQETLSVSGITLMKLFVREDYERERLRRCGDELMAVQTRLRAAGQGLNVALGILGVAGPASLWLFGGALAAGRHLHTGTIVAFVTLIGTRLYGPASALVGTHVSLMSAAAVFQRVFGYLDLAPEQDLPPGVTDPAEIRGEIAFRNVSFAYDATGERALSDVDFTIEAGQTAAFVGVSGAGKSTIANLVTRLYVPQQGRVEIDGRDVSTISLGMLRRNVGVVSQETYLHHDTVAANLRYAKPDASDFEIERAARMAKIHDVIMALPQGYQTVVGQRGHRLSGGERQRLAIARVLLKNPRIVILDEATSALDRINEAAIQRELGAAMEGRTTLVIAHRLETITRADVIFVVDGGRIVERGTHEQLVRRRGAYAKLYGRDAEMAQAS